MTIDVASATAGFNGVQLGGTAAMYGLDGYSGSSAFVTGLKVSTSIAAWTMSSQPTEIQEFVYSDVIDIHRRETTAAWISIGVGSLASWAVGPVFGVFVGSLAGTIVVGRELDKVSNRLFPPLE